MTVETLKADQLLPKKFEFLRNNRWIVQADGIDPFLVKSVEGPKLTRRNIPVKIKIALHNIVAGNDSKSIIEWLQSAIDRPVVVKHLDPVGTVVELWRFNARPKKVSFSKLDYSDASLLTTYVTLETTDFKVGFDE